MTYKKSFLIFCASAWLMVAGAKAETDWPLLDFSREKLTALLQPLGLSVPDSYQELVNLTQQKFMRAPGIERWDVSDLYAQRKSELMPLLRDIGFIDEITTEQQHFNYVLVFGATAKVIAKRLGYVISLWQQGVHFDHLVFLVGQRSLQPYEKKFLQDTYGQKAAWETDAAKLLYDHTPIPNELKKVPVTFIDTPAQKTSEGRLQRPTTGSSIREWLKTNHTPGTILAISSQPYVLYQDAVLNCLISDGSVVKTVGPAAHSDESITTILDSLARYLFVKNTKADGARVLFNL